MDSRFARPTRFAFALAWRAMFVAALAFVAVQLLATTHFYATIVLILGVAALVTADIARLVGQADRSAQHDFERLVETGSDVPRVKSADLPGSTLPFERAASILNAARTERQQQLEYLQTLLDTVAAALIVLDAEGGAMLANRAARSLARGGTVDRLDQIDALGAAGASHLQGLAPGAREIVSLAEGRRAFVAVSQFTVPGQAPRRLLSLQRIAGELDVVELKAWQEMADVLAHEMMNSLTPIASLSESLETLLRVPDGANDSSQEVAGALEAIKRRSRGLMEFVARYRAVAELPPACLQPLRMDEFLRGIDRLLAPALKDRGIAYGSSVSPQALTANADPQLLEQAVINLLRNAGDAVASAREPRIEVCCELREGRVVMSISDNGCGVPDARREQIFVPFFTTKPGGSGIGLNLARHVVLKHGGQLDVRANVPFGTVFTLSLPALP